MKSWYIERAFACWLACAATAWGAGDWPGFRGLEKQGWSEAVNGPVCWSTNQNVVWKTRIAGQGHSSPVVSGDAVFVTTAYASRAHEHLRTGVRWAAVALGVVVWAGYLWCLLRPARSGAAPKLERWWRAVVGLGYSSALVLSLLCGSRFLGLESQDVRAWQLAMVIVFGSFATAWIAITPRSPAWWFLGVLSLGFALPAWWLFPERDELFHVDGPSAAASVGLLAMPVVSSLAAVVVHHAARRRFPARAPGVTTTRAGVGAWLAVPALLAGGLYFVDASHLRRTKELVRAIVCLGLVDGRVRWTCEGLAGSQRALTAMNTPATPTPLVDGERVLAWFASAGLLCADLRGNLLWSKPALASEPTYGTATSPILCDGAVVLVNDVEEPGTGAQPPRSWIAAMDARSGHELWRRERKGHPRFASYATPVSDRRSGTNIVWVVGWHGVEGYEARSGKTMGRFAWDVTAHHLAASSVLAGDRLFVPGASRHVCLDVRKLLSGESPVLWSQRARGEISSSPLVADGLVFLVAENGHAACLDLATGERRWERRLPQSHFASVTASGDRVYFASEGGGTSVTRRGARFELLAENELGERQYASFAPAGERLLIRGVEHLHCIAEPQ